jgi:uncharacterized protein
VSFSAKGHPAVLSTHSTAIEVTKERDLTSRGDCIVAVCSGMGARDLPNALRAALARSETIARAVFSVGGFEFEVRGRGDPGLKLSHPTDLVIRRSGFVSDRTLMIHADKSAKDIPRGMVRLLQDPTNAVLIEISTSTRE